MSEKESSCSSCSAQSCPGEAEGQGCGTVENHLSHIRNKILVMSGKGGVGKSSTAVNLALALAAADNAVGLLDIDIHGPSVPKMLGLDDAKPKFTDAGVVPVSYGGMKVMSVGFYLEKADDALIWRGPAKTGAIQQLIADVDWGYLDYLIVDCPPGTGDEPLSVAQALGTVDGAVVVTTPQEVALIDVRKSITFCRQLKMPVVGIVENMSGLLCPHCNEVVEIFKRGGGEELATELQVPFLSRIPIDPAMVHAGDSGAPYLVANPDSEISKTFGELAEMTEQHCARQAISRAS